MIAAIFSNPNWDDEKNNRPSRLRELEANYNRAIEVVYNPDLAKEGEQAIDWDNPFWQAEARAQKRLKAFAAQRQLQPPAVEFTKEQQEARERARKEVDQL